MSIKAINWAWKQSLPPGQKLVLIRLADRADDNGECWPSQKSIAEDTGQNERTVRRIVKQLESRGLLTRYWGQYREDGSRGSDHYKLHLQDTMPGRLEDTMPGSTDVTQNTTGQMVQDYRTNGAELQDTMPGRLQDTMPAKSTNTEPPIESPRTHTLLSDSPNPTCFSGEVDFEEKAEEMTRDTTDGEKLYTYYVEAVAAQGKTFMDTETLTAERLGKLAELARRPNAERFIDHLVGLPYRTHYNALTPIENNFGQWKVYMKSQKAPDAVPTT